MKTTSAENVPNANVEQLLFFGRNLNFQSTADQALAKRFSGTNFVVTRVIAKRATGAGSVACAGGLYSATSKGGSAIVAASQSWVTLAANVIVQATVTLITAQLSSSNLYISLTTGSTAAVTADVYVFGLIID